MLKQNQKHVIRIVHSLTVSLEEVNMTSETPIKRIDYQCDGFILKVKLQERKQCQKVGVRHWEEGGAVI